jgi:cyclopropane fatty-acyl-phospholipid synthase-like methyltransferase
MTTNPIGKGTKTIGINMSKDMADEIEKRASSMHLSASKYAKLILLDWLESDKKLTLKEGQI